MLFRNMNVGAFNAAFQQRPVRFERVHMRNRSIHIVTSVFLLAVINLLMFISAIRERSIAGMLIGMYYCSLCYVFSDDWQKCFPLRIVYNFGHNFAVALKHTEYDCLPTRTASAFAAMPHAANQSLVNFNVARKLVLTVNGSHVLADLLICDKLCL